MPIIMFYNFAANILRAIGDAKRPMYFLITSGVVKVVLTVILLLITDMTVESVAIATVIGMLVAAVLAFVTIRKNKEVINIDFRTIKFSFKELREMMFIGVPTGLQTSLYSLANAVIASAVNSFGADATTGISIANQFDNLIYYVAFGPAVAATTYIAQNVGARRLSVLKRRFSAHCLLQLESAVFVVQSLLFSQNSSRQLCLRHLRLLLTLHRKWLLSQVSILSVA